MSITQAIIASISGGAPRITGAGYFNQYMDENQTNTGYVTYENQRGQWIYWSLWNGSTTDSDWSGGTLPSGQFYISGSGTYYFNWTTADDRTTEGQEHYGLIIGTYPGGQDIGNYYWLFVNDTSQSPAFIYNDFTIEWWSKMADGQSANPRLFDVGYWQGENPGFSIEDNGNIIVWGGGADDRVTATYSQHNVWIHWAIERHNGTIQLYKNGSNILSSNNVGAVKISNTTDTLSIGWGSGNYWKGKITDFHWVKGYAKYQGSFSPPTQPVTSRLGSKLLLNVVDDSTRAVDATGLHTGDIVFANTPITFSSDSPYTFPAPVLRSTGAGGQDGQGYYMLQFSDTYTDLLAVKAGWLVSDGAGFTDTVYLDAYSIQGAIWVKLTSKVSPPLPGTYTFTNPVQATGSLVFDGTGYLTITAHPDWAIDFSDVVTNGLTLNLDANNPSSYPGNGSTWSNLATAGSSGNVTLTGSPTYSPGPPAYVNFSGSGQYALGTTANILSNDQYTKIIWFNLNSIGADNNLVSSFSGGHYIFTMSTNRIYCGHTAWANNTTNINPSVATISVGTWYMAAVTFNTTDGMSLYINGVLDHTYTTYKTGITGDGSTNIGCYGANGNLLNGKIGQVMCYNRSLTAQEVLDNFNATRNRYNV